jgi:hypothetical protein
MSYSLTSPASRPRVRIQLAAMAVLGMLTLLMTGCGGSGSNGGYDMTAQSAPSAPSTPPAPPSSTTLTLDAAGGSTQVGVSGYSAQLTIPANTSTAATLSVAASTTAPAGVAVMASSAPSSSASVKRSALQMSVQAVATASQGSTSSTLIYLTVTPTADVTLSAFPAVSVTLPSSMTLSGATLSLAYFDPATQSWTDFGNVDVQGAVVSFSGFAEKLAWSSGKTYVFAVYQLQASGLVSGSLVVTDIPSIDDTLALAVTGMPAIRAFNLSTKNCVTAGADPTGMPLMTCTMTDIFAPAAAGVEFYGGTWSSGSGFPPVYDACYEATQDITADGYTVSAQDKVSPGCAAYAAAPDEGPMTPPESLCISIPAGTVVPNGDDMHNMACSNRASPSYNDAAVQAYICNHAGGSATYQQNNPCPAGTGPTVPAVLTYTLSGGGVYTGTIKVIDDGSIQSTYNTAAPGCEDLETFSNPITVAPRMTTGSGNTFTVSAGALTANYSAAADQCAIVFVDDMGDAVLLYLNMFR